MEKKYIFICGLHRSGTSTLTKIIGTSNLVSTHTNTNVHENEGQHIQSVYDPAYKHGGPLENLVLIKNIIILKNHIY